MQMDNPKEFARLIIGDIFPSTLKNDNDFIKEE